ncbi:MAG: glycine cleavage T C-terminal barrel domain-containing protein [Bryobacteraceae bacterium]
MSELQMTGYSALHEHAAWIDLSARGRIRVSGDDRARLLHAMTTQHIQQMRPGDGAYTFFLNAQGRILADAWVFCFEDHFLLDTEPETRARIYEHLDRYIIADDVAVEDVTAQMASIAVEGPSAGAVLESLGATLPSNDGALQRWGAISDEAGGEVWLARVSATGTPGFRLFLDTTAKADFLQRLSSLPAGSLPEASLEETRIVRIENGHPRYGEEMSDRFLVQETGQLQGIHFTKGCYLGQEIVERVRSRAQIHRVLRKLEIVAASGNVTPTLPEHGVKLKVGEAEAAEIASAVQSPATGKIIALAYVRTQFAEPGTDIVSGAYKARVL